jgi:hypothetical protein
MNTGHWISLAFLALGLLRLGLYLRGRRGPRF